MRVISNAMMDNQAEIIQVDRWDHGPLELLFLDTAQVTRERFPVELNMALVEWNRNFRGGFARPGESLDTLEKFIPGLPKLTNPNVFIAPTVDGFSELHAMLASVVPESILKKYGIEKIQAMFWLWPIFRDDVRSSAYAAAAENAFHEFIWQKLARKKRLKKLHFADNSSLRLLAGDTRFWMNRLYRVAIDRSEWFEEAHNDKWDSLEKLEAAARQQLPADEQDKFLVRRPLMGGELWDPEDPDECDQVVEEMLDGGGVMDSLHPVIDILHSHRTHEDFSDRYSWVKEDFERSFYSKRSKVKVSLVETVDDLPAWEATEPDGYGEILFRDLMCFVDPKDRHIVLALRQGKTVTEIARDNGLNGHAAISRRVKQIRAQLREILQPS